ncbi:hypothetical protein ROZALSC1DRAFT_22687 [Rozella allomycis CSF55]|uniref:Uncharacterized protein n=1 Tax=Rozella allomycis (strain CSF55) TaxID=988480 RepID=A0A4P9YHZ5_ROZAC|nr:hypothetical protein ROZALSC1DRAFT_22687 [Rozella allomycis CSF55]
MISLTTKTSNDGSYYEVRDWHLPKRFNLFNWFSEKKKRNLYKRQIRHTSEKIADHLEAEYFDDDFDTFVPDETMQTGTILSDCLTRIEKKYPHLMDTKLYFKLNKVRHHPQLMRIWDKIDLDSQKRIFWANNQFAVHINWMGFSVFFYKDSLDQLSNATNVATATFSLLTSASAAFPPILSIAPIVASFIALQITVLKIVDKGFGSLTEHPTIHKYLSRFNPEEQTRVLKYLSLFAIQTLSANYPSLTLSDLEDMVYEQQGKLLVNPFNIHRQERERSVDDSEKENNRKESINSPKNLNCEIKSGNKSIQKTSSLGKVKPITPLYGTPKWWGHDEAEKKGVTLKDIKDCKMKEMKEKDKQAYLNLMRRKNYHPKEFNFVKNSARKEEKFTIPALINNNDTNIYCFEESNDNVLDITRNFLTNRAFLNCLGVE